MNTKLSLEESFRVEGSLTALGRVVCALVDQNCSYVPYKSSILTHLLQNSFQGDCKTVFIAHCSPSDCDFNETLNTLKFAAKVMKVVKKKPILKVERHQVCKNNVLFGSAVVESTDSSHTEGTEVSIGNSVELDSIITQVCCG